MAINSIGTPKITLAGIFTMSGAFSFTGTLTGTTTVTFPTSGTLATTSQIAMVLLASATASSSADIQFTNLTGYTNYLILMNQMLVSTNTAGVEVQYSLDNGSTWRSTSGDYFWQVVAASNTTLTGAASSTTGFHPTTSSMSNGSGAGACGYVYLEALNSASAQKGCNSRMAYINSTGPTVSSYFADGVFKTTSAITAVRIVASSGNLASGTAQIYGIN